MTMKQLKTIFKEKEVNTKTKKDNKYKSQTQKLKPQLLPIKIMQKDLIGHQLKEVA